MKLLVAVKQVKVVGDELELTGDGRDVDPDFLDRALNEWDACAVEEALQLRERLGGGEVVAVTVGDAGAEAGLRRALAMGADRAARVAAEPFDPVSTARALAGVARAEAPDLVLCGVQSADSVQGSTGVALAELLGLPRVAVVTKLEWSGSGPARVQRELEGGLIDEVEVDTPALLTIQTGINAPRYANLRAIKQAEQHEIPVLPAGELGEPAYRVRRMFSPPRGEGAELLQGSPEAVAEQILAIVRERLA
jgi:electron transfer flavoprotein beta subunit